MSFSDSDLKQNIQPNFLYSICISQTDHHTSLGKITIFFRRRKIQTLALIIRIARVGITTKTPGKTVYGFLIDTMPILKSLPYNLNRSVLIVNEIIPLELCLVFSHKTNDTGTLSYGIVTSI